jgi:transcriptional regulator with XRE-family HTH domain
MKTRSRSAPQRSPELRLNQNPQAVRRLRLLAGFRQKDLAAAAGLSPNHLCNIEKGTRSAGVEALHRLAKVLECPVAALIAEEPDSP